MTKKNALLLINLGTPDSPKPEDVKKYLKEFLMDPFVVDIPGPMRWALVRLILRKRPAKSGALYEKIWTERGSPLLVHHEDLAREVAAKMSDWAVAPAMRYGNPSTESALEKLREMNPKPEKLLLFPLYPQYSLAATESSLEYARKLAKKIFPDTPIVEVKPFYDHSSFIQAFADRVAKKLREFPSDHVLFSFHGLPERQIRRVDQSGQCLAGFDCCDAIVDRNRGCYRAQSFATARLIAKRAGLSPEKYSVGFQSRLGVTPWIRPYTDLILPELANRGLKRVAVCCPSFVADCLETLEEVGIRSREAFRASGGEDLALVPSLNSGSDWVDVVANIAANLAG